MFLAMALLTDPMVLQIRAGKTDKYFHAGNMQSCMEIEAGYNT